MVKRLSRTRHAIGRSVGNNSGLARRLGMEWLEDRRLLSVVNLPEEAASPPFVEVSSTVLEQEAATSAQRLFALLVNDDIGRIYEIDPDTGAELNSFPAPERIGTSGYQGLALGPRSLFFIDGSGTGPHWLYELDMSSGNEIHSYLVGGENDPAVSSLAYLNGYVYLGYHKTTTLVSWNLATNELGTCIEVPYPISGGMTGACDLSLLFASTHDKQVISISPANGEVKRLFSTSSRLSGGLAYVNGALFGAALDSGYIHRFNSSGSLLDRFAPPDSGNLAALAGDGMTPAAAEIHGSVWSDVNGNRRHDEGEPGLEGWTVFLDDDEDGIQDPLETSVITDKDGLYVFADVAPGTRLVSARMRPAWGQTYPGPTASQGRLFVLWMDEDSGVGTIVEVRADDGTIVNRFYAPGAAITAGLQGLAVGPDRLYYLDGESFVLYELALDSGAVIDSHVLTPTHEGTVSGLAWHDGLLYLVQQDRERLMAWDPVAETFVDTLSFTGIDLSGSLAGAPGDGLLFCGNGRGEIIGIDPDTGNVARSFSTGLGQLKGGMAYVNGELIVGAFDPSATVYRLDPVSGDLRGTLQVGNPQLGHLVGLGGDGAVGTGSFSSHYVHVSPGLLVTNVSFGNIPVIETLYGSTGDDRITVTLSDSKYVVTINGEGFAFDQAEVMEVHIDALGGNDAITISGTAEREAATLRTDSVDVFGPGYSVYGVNVETIVVNGAGGGDDEATLIGSNDPACSTRLYSYPEYSRLLDSTRSFSHRVNDFETVNTTVAMGGRSYAFFYDSPENDMLSMSPKGIQLDREDGSTSRTAAGFQSVYVYATQAGSDKAMMSGADDATSRFYSYSDYGFLTDSTQSFYFYARGFDSLTADSPGSGCSYAYFHDSPGVDTFETTPASAMMNRADSWSDVEATGFERVYAYSTRGGDDIALLKGSEAGDNRFRAYPTYALLTDSTDSFYRYVSRFDSVKAIGSSSPTSGDLAHLYDSSGNDTFSTSEDFLENGKYQGGSLTDTSGTYTVSIKYFDLVYARSSDRGTIDKISVDIRLLAYNLIRSGTW